MLGSWSLTMLWCIVRAVVAVYILRPCVFLQFGFQLKVHHCLTAVHTAVSKHSVHPIEMALYSSLFSHAYSCHLNMHETHAYSCYLNMHENT